MAKRRVWPATAGRLSTQCDSRFPRSSERSLNAKAARMRTPWRATAADRTRAAHPTVVGSDWPLPYRITHRRHYFNCVLCQSLPRRPRKPAAYGACWVVEQPSAAEVASPFDGEHSCVAHRRHGERSRSDGAATTDSFTDAVEHFVAAEISSNDGNGHELTRAAS